MHLYWRCSSLITQSKLGPIQGFVRTFVNEDSPDCDNAPKRCQDLSIPFPHYQSQTNSMDANPTRPYPTPVAKLETATAQYCLRHRIRFEFISPTLRQLQQQRCKPHSQNLRPTAKHVYTSYTGNAQRAEQLLS